LLGILKKGERLGISRKIPLGLLGVLEGKAFALFFVKFGRIFKRREITLLVSIERCGGRVSAGDRGCE
jgi:hypothetical protein